MDAEKGRRGRNMAGDEAAWEDGGHIAEDSQVGPRNSATRIFQRFSPRMETWVRPVWGK